MRKDIVDVKNEADAVIFQTEKLIKDNEETITGEDKAVLEAALGKLKEMNDGMNIDTMTQEDVQTLAAEIAEVAKVMQEIGGKIYQAAAEQHQHEHGNVNEDGTVEGEYEEVDEE